MLNSFFWNDSSILHHLTTGNLSVEYNSQRKKYDGYIIINRYITKLMLTFFKQVQVLT